MRLQIASDLHLEKRPKQTFKEILDPGTAPLLALLGDVAPLDHPNLQPFLEWCSENWETTIWIPGCLEMLGGPDAEVEGIEARVERMRAVAAPYQNVVVLNREGMVSSDGVYIFGLPFWKFPRDGTAVWHPQFYRYVEAEPSPLPPPVLKWLYKRDLAWIKEKARVQREPIVVLSHYGPTTWLQEETFVGDPDRSLVDHETEELLKPPIVAWICGHCHQGCTYSKEWSAATGEKGSVLLACNPRGVPFENLSFRPDAVVRIDPSLYRNGAGEWMGGGRI
jgi:hypothetical protein